MVCLGWRGCEQGRGMAGWGGVFQRRAGVVPASCHREAQQALRHVTFRDLLDVAGAGVEPRQVSLPAEVFLSE